MQIALLIDINGRVRHWTWNCYKARSELFGYVIILGGGTKQFLEYIHTVSPMEKVTRKINTPSDFIRFDYILKYFTSILRLQSATGYGIDEAWGGGFELALIKNEKYIEKIDNIFFHSYSYSIKDDLVVCLSNSGHRTFQFYIDSDLVIVTQSDNNQTSFYRVPHLRTEGDYEQEIDIGNRPAQFIYLNFHHRETNVTYSHTSYCEFGSKYFGLHQSNRKYCIHVDILHVIDLIKRNHSLGDI